MERLTTRNIAGVAVYKNPFECEQCGKVIWRLPDYGNGSPTEKLADYEDTEEQGRMIVFPCNKGDKIYEFYRECVECRLDAGETPENIINVRKVYGFEYEDDVLYIRASYHSNHSELWGGYGEDTPEFPVSEIDKTVFLSYEEAEAKLKELRVEENG